jgi:putative ABC transport system substrate-binding protein
VDRRAFLGIVAGGLLAAPLAVGAQQARVHRVGVILQGGPYMLAVDGLREGLGKLGFEEGKEFVLHVRDAGGDITRVEAAARELELDNVDMIYSVATSVTVIVKRATQKVPIVFYAGTDPVAAGLVESFSKPGGRITGSHGQFADLGAKRLEVLKALVPTLRRVGTFYSPHNPVYPHNAKIARLAAERLNMELVEWPVASVEELRTRLRALRRKDVDALLVIDAMMGSQSELIIEVGRTKQLPTMFSEREIVHKGGLVSYGIDYYAAGSLSARQVQRILLGADPGTLPVEQLNRLRLTINRNTANTLGLTIPPSVLARADEVIE